MPAVHLLVKEVWEGTVLTDYELLGAFPPSKVGKLKAMQEVRLKAHKDSNGMATTENFRSSEPLDFMITILLPLNAMVVFRAVYVKAGSERPANISGIGGKR